MNPESAKKRTRIQYTHAQYAEITDSKIGLFERRPAPSPVATNRRTFRIDRYVTSSPTSAAILSPPLEAESFLGYRSNAYRRLRRRGYGDADDERGESGIPPCCDIVHRFIRRTRTMQKALIQIEGLPLAPGK